MTPDSNPTAWFRKQDLPRLHWLALVLLCGVNLLLYVLCANRYGYFRDELYFLDCGRHLDWGYVDHAPLIAVYSRVALWLGGSLWVMRAISYFTGMVRIALSMMLARRLGGGAFAQTLAGITTLLCPMYLSTDSLLTMNCFESLYWMGCVYVLLLMVQTGNSRLWLWFGVIAGLGLENKHSTLFFGFAVLVAVLLTPMRRELAKPWIWVGGALAMLIFLPNALWQVQHHFPTLELLRNVKASGKDVAHTPISFFLEQVIVTNPLFALVWLFGLYSLLMGRLTRYRFMAWLYLVLLVIFIVLQGKNYYLAPAYPMLLAAGAAAMEAVLLAWRPQAVWPRTAIIAAVSSGILLVPVLTPLLPPEKYVAFSKALHLSVPKSEVHHSGPLPQFLGDQFGWPELVSEVASAYYAIPPEQRARTGIFANNYGEAGALAMFGPEHGLPRPLSAHQNYFYWGPPTEAYTDFIVLQDSREGLEKVCGSVDLLFEHHHDFGMAEENAPVYLCRGIKLDPRDPAVWAKLKKWR